MSDWIQLTLTFSKHLFPWHALLFFLLNQIQTNVIVTGNRTVERPNVLTLPGAMFANANLDISSTKFRKPVKVCNYGLAPWVGKVKETMCTKWLPVHLTRSRQHALVLQKQNLSRNLPATQWVFMSCTSLVTMDGYDFPSRWSLRLSKLF